MVRRASLVLLAVLAACAKPDAPEERPPRDPLVEQALNDPLMIDPDLSQRNEAAAALTVTTDTRLPVLPVSADALAAARAEAARAVGGQDRLTPAPAPIGDAPSLPGAWSPRSHLSVLGARPACLDRLATSAIWAARMPDALPVYPRAAALAAAGSEGAGCRARAVRFQTPVPIGEVLAFYWTKAESRRLRPQHRSAGDVAVLQGRGIGIAFDLRARAEGEQTVVELATLSR